MRECDIVNEHYKTCVASFNISFSIKFVFIFSPKKFKTLLDLGSKDYIQLEKKNVFSDSFSFFSVEFLLRAYRLAGAGAHIRFFKNLLICKVYVFKEKVDQGICESSSEFTSLSGKHSLHQAINY